MERYKKFEDVLLGSYFTKIESLYENNAAEICVILAKYIERLVTEQDTRLSDIEAEQLVSHTVCLLFPEVVLCKRPRFVKISLEIITSYRKHILVDQEAPPFPIGEIIDRCGYFENVLIKTHSIAIGSLYKDKVSAICVFLGRRLAMAESESGKVLSDIEVEQLVSHIVCILFPEEPYCEHLCDISVAVANNYGASISIDLGGLQTPYIVDGVNTNGKPQEALVEKA